MIGEPYKCALCKKIYNKTREDTKALEEYKELWPKAFANNDPVELVCDLCFSKVIEWALAEGIEL
jgi:hypothetical protein